MEARTTRLDTLTHYQGHSPQTREHGNRPMAVMGHPEELTTLVTTLFQRGQDHFMRRFGACASSCHHSSPVVGMYLPFLLDYTCCQPEFAIEREKNTYLHTLIDHHTTLTSPYKAGSSTLTTYQSYCVYTTAFKGLVDWPIGFHNFLDAQFSSPGSEKHLRQSPGKVGSIYVQWLQHNWQHPAFDFIQKAFDDYLAERYDIARSIVGSNRFLHNPSAKVSTTYVSINYAARLLEALPISVQELISSGELTPQYYERK